MPTGTIDAYELARAIREVMLAFGRPVTKEELAERLNLPVSTVGRRLMSSGTSNIDLQFRYFSRSKDGLWSLTQVGREVALNHFLESATPSR